MGLFCEGWLHSCALFTGKGQLKNLFKPLIMVLEPLFTVSSLRSCIGKEPPCTGLGPPCMAFEYPYRGVKSPLVNPNIVFSASFSPHNTFNFNHLKREEQDQ